MKKEFILLEDTTQKVVLKVEEKKDGYFEIRHDSLNAQTMEPYTTDSFELTRSELKELGQWICQNLNEGD